MAEYSLEVLKTGLTPEERKTLTFDRLRSERLVALCDGAPVYRALPRPKGEGEPSTTPSPTLEHLAVALDLPLSSVRAYFSGRNVPRMTVPEMVRVASSLGLTVEELAFVVQNSRTARLA